MPVKFRVKAVRIGNSTRMTIPIEITKHLRISPGDTLVAWVDNNHLIVEKQQLPTQKS